ncbi:hypothetical protein [uncultured Pseudokineococcus sp.]|uniref:hypothetical protein n=1 Tax=uncultured Pseudokineococcus sp. TaxID=1642928 RepID=UPI0026383B18|nr:hypothetical protein [uncultured Pseudokineococcus sp.]
MQLRLSVHAAGPDLVAYRRDGVEHSRWPITPTDPFVELERLARPAPAEAAGPHLASTAALDEALERQGYRRLTDWAPGPTGPVCEVTLRTT